MNNLDRMIGLAESFFETRSDPDQISVTGETLELFAKIHPSTLGEERNEDGPIAWTLVLPSTHKLMEAFVGGAINERQLLEQTPLNVTYESIYLCSALVLPEFRGKGLAKKLVTRSILDIKRDHPISSLFSWSFSVEGKGLAASMSRHFGIPILERGRWKE